MPWFAFTFSSELFLHAFQTRFFKGYQHPCPSLLGGPLASGVTAFLAVLPLQRGFAAESRAQLEVFRDPLRDLPWGVREVKHSKQPLKQQVLNAKKNMFRGMFPLVYMIP